MIPPFDTEEEAVAWAVTMGYTAPKVIGGRLVALHDYITTRGIVFINDIAGVDRRYCYQDRTEAITAYLKYDDPDTHPAGNWIKHKGIFRGKPVDDLNPNWSKGPL